MPQVGTLGGAIFWYQTDNCYIYSCLQNSSFLQDAFTHACMLPASNFSLPLKQSFLGRSSFQNSTELEVKKKKKGWSGESHPVAPLKSCVNLGKLFIFLSLSVLVSAYFERFC